MHPPLLMRSVAFDRSTYVFAQAYSPLRHKISQLDTGDVVFDVIEYLIRHTITVRFPSR